MLTETQIAERTRYIGGSDAAAILGMSRFKTPLEVWAEKTGAVPPADLSDRLAIEVGNELEDLVCKLFSRRTGKETRRVNETIFHTKHSFLGANIDRRVVGEDAILEAKTCSGWKAEEWEGDAVPQEYVLQAMHYLGVTGKDHCYVAVLIGGNQDFVWKVVERDADLISEIQAREVEFWQKFVETKAMPHIVTHRDGDILRRLFPEGTGAATLGADADAVAESIKTLQVEEKRIVEAIETEKNRLKQILGDAEGGETQRFKISWKNQASKRLDLDRFKTERPELYKAYLKESQTRVLRVAEIKTKPTAPVA